MLRKRRCTRVQIFSSSDRCPTTLPTYLSPSFYGSGGQKLEELHRTQRRIIGLCVIGQRSDGTKATMELELILRARTIRII
jgi:hypothetical protein